MRTRPVIAALRLVTGLALLSTIVIQIADRVVHDAFDPWEYFSYFTIETSLINVVVFIVGAYMAATLVEDTRLYTAVRMSALTYAVVTAGVYNLLLRNVPYAGAYEGLHWPNEVIHVVIPAAILLDWVFSPGRPALPWSSLRIVLVYPVLWLAYTLGRGAASGGEIYPYPFLDPDTAGWGSVVAYILGLTAFLVAIGALALEYGRLRATRPRRFAVASRSAL